MNHVLGEVGIRLGVLGSLGAIVMLAAGLRAGDVRALRASRWFALTVLAGAVLAVVGMERALITRDFTVQYVADHGSTRTPPLFNVATMWAALEGSILLWALVLTGYVALTAHHFRKRLDDRLV